MSFRSWRSQGNVSEGRVRRGRRIVIEPLEERRVLSVTAELVADINTGTTIGSAPTVAAVSGDQVYFRAAIGDRGTIWHSDGTTAGTTQFLASESINVSASWLATLGGFVYFNASDGTHGTELWKSDGTAEGTQMLADINPGSGNAAASNFTTIGDLLYFSATSGNGQVQLWRTDGTTAGTVVLTNAPVSSSFSNFVELNGELFFTLASSDPNNSAKIWKSDGTAAGTTPLFDPLSAPGQATMQTFGKHQLLLNAGGTLYFSMVTPGGDDQLWTSDGTEAGSTLVTTIKTNAGSKSAQWFANANGTVYFLDQPTASSGLALYRTDGTAEGTSVVDSTLVYNTSNGLIGFDNEVAFFATSGLVNGLWTSDGTTTSLVKDFKPGSSQVDFDDFAVMDGELYFTAAQDASGAELWRSDSTEAGTQLVKDIGPGSADASITSLINVGSELFFFADDGIHGAEPWLSDGSSAGTNLLRDINLEGSGSTPRGFVGVGGQVLFAATDTAHGVELWSTDGTSAGTSLLQDIQPGLADSLYSANTALGVVVGDFLYFAADDGIHGNELWRSDGTAGGTTLAYDYRPDSEGISIQRMAKLNDLLIYSVRFTSGSGPFSQNVRVLAFDGTNVTTLTGNNGPTVTNYITTIGDVAYFDAASGPANTVNRQLYRTDGTVAGTWVVNDIFPGGNARPEYLTSVGETLYFSADDGVHGRELWKTDGTSAGTVLVADLNPGTAGSGPARLTNIGGTLFFIASGQLYTSDGTAAGTVPLGATQGTTSIVELDGIAYYNSAGALWRSDGALAGTYLVADFSAGGSSSVDGLTVADGRLYFVANDGLHGKELWASNGTSAGTFLVADIWPGSQTSVPQSLTNIDGTLYFAANNGITGLELWKVAPNSPPTAAIDGPLGVPRGQSQDFTLTAIDPSSADQAAGFTFTIDWNGDGSDVEIANGLSGLVVAHKFSTVGPRDVKVTATDVDGGVSDVAILTVSVSAATTDEHEGVTDLVWTGTAGADSVTFEQLDATTIRVTTTLENGLATNFVETFTGITGVVRGSGLAGNDTLDAALLTTTAALLDGGTGNNTLFGGDANDTLIGGANWAPSADGPEGQQGNNIVVGGAGDDTIYGNAINGAEGRGGNNILLGGAGNDTIYGNWTDGGEGGGRNILVGGADSDTLYDYKLADGAEGKGSILIADETSLGLIELGAVLAEWTANHPYSQRVDNLSGTGGGGDNGSTYLQASSTVNADAAADTLWGSTGGTGLNWFWYTLAVDAVNRTQVDETHSTL
ncbi:MAG: ELWxxDGT repeat protein [Pirellulales bacterium]